MLHPFIVKIIRPVWLSLKRQYLLALRSRIDKRMDRTRLKEIPIIINNRNRVTVLKQLIERLEKAGMQNIHILDNDSTYPPVLDFYRETKYSVFYLGKNMGSTALWDSHLFKLFRGSYYIYTDPDVVPVDECPDDFILRLFEVLEKYPHVEKVGLGLRIDDLPDHYLKKDQVIQWESKFWQHEVEKDLYDADVDTTFALYRPYARGPAWECRSLRTAGNYMVRHLPWYEDWNNLTEEELYYHKTVHRLSVYWSKTSLPSAPGQAS